MFTLHKLPRTTSTFLATLLLAGMLFGLTSSIAVFAETAESIPAGKASFSTVRPIASKETVVQSPRAVPIFYMDDAAGFNTAVSSLAFKGLEDFESSTLGANLIQTFNDPLAPGVANSVFPSGTNPAIGLTVQSNNLGQNPTMPDPHGTNGLVTASQGYISTPSDQVGNNFPDDSLDLIFSLSGGELVRAVSFIPLFFDESGIDLTDTLTVRVYDASNTFLGSGTITGGNYQTANSFVGVVVAVSDSIGRINLVESSPTNDFVGVDDVRVYSSLPVAISATKTDSLIIDNDSDGAADPGDTIRYTVAITNTGSDPATGVVFTDTIDANTTLSGTAHISPMAIEDSYASLGNAGITVPAGSGLLSNDVDPDNNSGTLTVANADSSSANGGDILVAADGSFTYTPAPGFEGADSFTYAVSDGDPLTPDEPGTVTITVNEVIWFVDNTAAGGGDGRLATPFNSLSAFNSGAADDPGDIVFLYSGSGNYTNGITLLDNQYLIGQGATASIAAITGITVPPHSNPLPGTGGTSPTITNGGGNGITLAAANMLRGFNVGAASGFGVAGSNVGTLAVSEVSVNNSSGGGVSLNGSGTMNVVFTTLSPSGGTNGIALTNVAGTFTVNGGSVSGSSGTAVAINGGNAAITYAGSISKANSGSLVSISNTTGGSVVLSGILRCVNACTGLSVTNNNTGAAKTITFSGGTKILNTGGNTAVNLTNNTGATINFTNGGLDIDTTSGAGFNATGGGTVNVTGSNNTLNAATGIGVNISNTTIGTNGVTFRNISVNGASSGIVLNNSGNGSFTVTGDGSLTRNDSGGVIQNTTATAVSLTNANNVSLRSLRIDAPSSYGIQSSGGSNLVFSALTIQNVNGVGADGWNAVNLGGVNRIDNDSLFQTFGALAGGAIDVVNNNTGMTSLTIDSSTFQNQDANNGATFIFIEGRGTSNMGTVAVTNNLFTNLSGNALSTSIIDTGTMTSLLNNNVFRAANPGGLGGISGLSATASGNGVHTITIDNNDFDDVQLAGGNAGTLAVAFFNTSSGSAIISNNEFKDLDGDGNVILDAQAIRVVSEQTGGGAVDVTISGNIVNDVGRHAIFVSARNQTPDLDVLIINNTIGNLAPVGFTNRDAIEILSEDDANLDVALQGNSVTANVSSQEILNVVTDRIMAGNTPVLNVTIGTTAGNSFTNSNGGGADNVVIETLDTGETICLNMANNTLTGVTTLDLFNSGGTFNVTQASAAALAAVNGGVTVSAPDSYNFGQPACQTPTITLVSNLLVEPDEAPAAIGDNSMGGVQFEATNGNSEIVVGNVPTAPNRASSVGGQISASEANVSVDKFVPYQLTAQLDRSSLLSNGRLLNSGETINIPIGTLPAGKSVTVVFDATVDNTIPANDTQVCNQAIIQSNELPDVLSDDPDTGAVDDPTCTAVPQADLSITKADGPDPVLPGSTLVYTITVTNNGPSDAQNVVVTDNLPGGVTFVSTSGCAEDPNGVPTCSLGTIAATNSAQVIIQTTVDIGTSGIITNTATVSSSTYDANGGNNSAIAETTVLEIDYGDVPDPTYPTLFASNGARHLITGPYLGLSVDGESDGQPEVTAMGDDGDGNDDEDGVTFTSALVTGNTADVDVVASAACTLSAWVDFNADGDWSDASEDIFPGGTALAAGNNSLSFTVPAGAIVGTTFARFRCTTAGAVSFTGQASDGEVEDYQVTIVDNQFSIGDVTMLEGNSGASLFMFTVTRTQNSLASSVAYATSDGTAVAGSDYTAVSLTTINFTAGGALTQTAVVSVTGDLMFELDETFTVTLSSPVGGSIGDGEGLGTILNDDVAPTMNLADVAGLETAGTFPFTVTLSAVSGLDASVSYSTTNGTAVAGSDYTGTSGNLTIPAGSVTGVISVTVLDDALPEATETFTLTLSNPISANIGDGTAVGTIIDDENPPNIISVSDVTADETAGLVTFTVSLDVVSGLDVLVDYATNAGTATAGADYTAVAGTLTIANGTLSNTVAVPILDDNLDEITETFTLDLSNAVNAAILDAQGIGSILDDDEAPVAVDDAYTTPEDTLLTAAAPGVLVNDSDGDGDGLTAVLDSAPANGAFNLNADGFFTYTPSLNFSGVDSFTYHTSDGFNDSNVATVMLTVTTVNDVPIAVDDATTTVEDTAVTVDVLANDVDVDGSDSFVVTAVIQPINGFVTVNPDSTVTYSPTLDFTGDDVFSYVVSDGVLTDTAVVTITVLPGLNPGLIYLPIIYNNYVQAPDLVVQSISVESDGTVEVIIANEGNAPVRDEFWVDLYIDPDPLPTAVNQIWTQLSDEGLVWAVDDLTTLVPGGTMILTSQDAVAELSNYSGSVVSGTVIAVQVDSANAETAVGGVVEDHELMGDPYNNILVVTVP